MRILVLGRMPQYVDYLKYYFNYHNIFSEYELIYFDPENTQILNDDVIVLYEREITKHIIDALINYFYDKNNTLIAFTVSSPNNKLTNGVFDYVISNGALHDVSYLSLKNNNTNTNENIKRVYDPVTILNNEKRKNKKIVGMSLFFNNENNNKYYYGIVENLVNFIKYLIHENYFVVLLPVVGEDQEYSMGIYDDIINTLFCKIDNYSNSYKQFYTNNLLSISNYEINYVYNLYKYLWVSFVMDYTGCLYSLYNKVPFVAIYTNGTNDIVTLLKDIKWDYYYKLDCDGNNYDGNYVVSRISVFMLQNNLRQIEETNRTILNNKIADYLDKCEQKLICSEIPTNLKDIVKIQYNTPRYVKYNRFINSIDKHRVNVIYDDIIKYVNYLGYKSLRHDLITKEHKDLILQYTNYCLCGSLNNKIINYFDEISANFLNNEIILNNNNATQFSNKSINYMDQNYYNNDPYQKILSSLGSSVGVGILLDIDVNRTFITNYKVASYIGILPYKKLWVGIVKNATLFNNEFENGNECIRRSLNYCRGLIVFSMCDKLLLNKFLQIPIYALDYPVIHDVIDVYSNLFSFKKFKSTQSVYLVPYKVGIVTSRLKDLVVVETKMCGIKSRVYIYKDTLVRNGCDIYVMHVNATDDLVSLIECIVHEIPVFINKTDYTTELLGNDYPLYYNELTIERDTRSKLKTTLIRKAYEYLRSVDKTRFMIETFVKKMF